MGVGGRSWVTASHAHPSGSSASASGPLARGQPLKTLPRPENSSCCNSGRLLRTESHRGNSGPQPQPHPGPHQGRTEWLCHVNDKKNKVNPERFLPPGCGSPEPLGNELLFGLLTFIQVSSEKLYKIQYVVWVVIKADTLVAYVNRRDTWSSRIAIFVGRRFRLQRRDSCSGSELKPAFSSFSGHVPSLPRGLTSRVCPARNK